MLVNDAKKALFKAAVAEKRRDNGFYPFKLEDVESELARILETSGKPLAHAVRLLSKVRAGDINGFLYRSGDISDAPRCLVGWLMAWVGTTDEMEFQQGAIRNPNCALPALESLIYSEKANCETPATSDTMKFIEFLLLEYISNASRQEQVSEGLEENQPVGAGIVWTEM